MKSCRSILLNLAITFAIGLSSQAQPKYSENLVGYVSLVLPPGFSIIGNPLVSTNNSVTKLFSEAPEGTTIYQYTQQGTYRTTSYEFGEWSNKSVTFLPGEGFFIKLPPGITLTNVFLGEIMTGRITNSVPIGYSLRASPIPISGPLQDFIGFTPTDGDSILQYDTSTQKYLPTRTFEFFSWSAAQPSIRVGEGFWIKRVKTGNPWIRVYNVGD